MCSMPKAIPVGDGDIDLARVRNFVCKPGPGYLQPGAHDLSSGKALRSPLLALGMLCYQVAKHSDS